MMSNKKPISPWEKEVKHVSPRTLMIAGLAVLCLICFSAVAMNFDQISAFISGDMAVSSSSISDPQPADGTGIKDPNYRNDANDPGEFQPIDPSITESEANGICDPSQDPFYQGNALIGGGINVESIDYNLQATVEEINDGENWAAVVHIKGNNYKIIFNADPGEVWYNANRWTVRIENFGYFDLTTSDDFPWRNDATITLSKTPRSNAKAEAESNSNH